MKATIYHNPRCSKSRQTLAILNEENIDIEIVEYLNTPPDKKTLQEILEKLNIKPIDLIRKGETIFKELNLAEKADDDDALLEAMINNPILIERPIVLANGKARIGRPPESVRDII